MTTLSAAQPMPPATPMPDGYPRHNPRIDEQRSVLHALVDAQPWPKQSWEDLIEELLALGRADVALARLAEAQRVVPSPFPSNNADRPSDHRR